MKIEYIAVPLIVLLAGQAGPRFQSGAEVVRVDVLVTNGGAPVAGLTAADFELRDSGVVQSIDAIAIEDVPVSMMLALDTSHSVRGEALQDLKLAAKGALDTLDAGDRAALITFSAELVFRADWTDDSSAVRRAIESTSAAGGTALWDAAYAAITHRDSVAGRRSLVLLFSDGEDTASWLPMTAVLDRARRTDAVVYGIDVRRTAGQSGALLYRSGIRLAENGPPPGEPLLPRLADLTGGQSFQAASTGALLDAFTRIVKEFRTRYLLTYTPGGVPQQGWHPIDVKLKNRRGQVRARRGYLR